MIRPCPPALQRSDRLRLAFLGVVALCSVLGVLSSNGSAATPTSFATGSLIIPMDTDLAGNHATYNQNYGMWKAYGLVYKLLQNGIPVQWAVTSTKTSTSDVEFTASSVNDKRTGTALGSWDYRGGPFVIDSAYASQALPIITAWWAANGNQPNVHEAQAPFLATVPMILTTAPRIANEAVNIGVTSAYYNAAGIPDSAGKPWSSTSPNVLTESQIANGGLYLQGAGCARIKYDIFVTPHNSGYSYSLSDPTDLGTKTYAQLDTFVHDGGGWTALCHSILSNENAIAQLTTNGTASVKALFKTSQPGGLPGGFLTTTGFSSIDNTGGTWNVLAPGLPTAQGVPTSVSNGLPGGSVQTWPAPGNAGAPTYYAGTQRVATFTGSGVSHDNIITGTYHNGTGAGRLTYIGGHSFGATVPYSSNADSPYLRAFFNSLLFNGSGTAKLDLTLGSSSYPQNGTGLLTVNVKNVGGSTAKGVGNAGITLASGFSYAGTLSGPAPTVSGQTLVWPGGLGDIAGGATAVSFQVSVDPSVSGTAGSTQLGTLSATFTDEFGGSFTAGICKDLTISPIPAPSLSKTPASQGPVNPGGAVTWTLTYGDTGGAALQSGVVQDTLPTGFVYVSSSSSPSLGAPTVIPGTHTLVRWSTGTVAANTASAGTITITARAGAITAGTGSPPLQTFTNNATLTGSDASANPYSTSASATVDDQALDISLGKTVDNAFLSTLPGSATYTMTPRTSDNTPLSNVRVIDPLPAGIVSAPTVGQGGSYGAYSPAAAVGGDDGAGSTTAITVSSNLVKTGTAVTVTLNVKSTLAVPGVSPGAMDADGGAFTCGSASPASANVPAGGAGVNFVFSCTTDGLGEYVFSDDASDGVSNDWPAATSASVLSVAGGGPNVALWNLGSNTNAIPGQTITSGYTSGVYGLRGGATATFQKFDTGSSSWSGEAATPATVSTGGALTTDGAGTVYALGGNLTQAFYAYTASSNTWAAKASTGTNVKDGGSAVFLNVGGTKYVFAAMGNNTKTFKRYDVAGNSWSAMANSLANVKGGGSLTTDGTNIYLVPGNNLKTFYRYNVGANTWTALANMTAAVNSGGASVYLGGFIYVFRGNKTNGFFRYSIAGNTWSAMAAPPGTVTTGGALATDGTSIYAFKGAATAFWRYNPATNLWTTLASFTAATGGGASLVYMPGVTPQGRFSSIDVSRSLGVTGDTVDVTLSLTASPSVGTIGAGTLTVTPVNGASCSTLTGPTLTSADTTSSSTGDPVTYKWTCTLAGGASPGSLTFGDSTVTGSGPVSFPAATSMSVLVSPPLTMQVAVPNGAPNPLQDTSLLLTDQASTASPTVSTWTGLPTFSLTKTTSPSAATTLSPGDPITYTMTVQNTGTGNATNVVVSDPLPAQAAYVSCSGGASCSNSAGTVTWNVGALSPGDSSTVTMTVATKTNLAVSDTDYTVSNTASVTSTEVGTPTPSNTVTNDLQVKPDVVKFASTGNAGNGDTVTYTVQISNPGAAFTADVTDSVPAGAAFSGTGTCSPSCTFGAGTVTWSVATIQPGTNTFTFDTTITATGGATVTNIATVDPTAPNLAPIPSNSVDTEVGPSLELVKLGDKTGLVEKDDVITYTLVVANESLVGATGATVTDPIPAGTTYVPGSCTTPAGSCAYSSGNVVWTLGAVGGNASVFLGFQLKVGVGTTQVSNIAHVSATNSPAPVDSNPVDNGITTYPLTVTIGAGQGTVTTDTGGVSCTDLGGICAVSYPSGTLVRLTAAGRNGQQFTGWSGNCAGSSPSCQVTMTQARNVTASFATPPASPDLVLVKSHAGTFQQNGTGSYALTASNLGGTPTSGSVSVVDTPPAGLTITGMTGTGWSCVVLTSTCTRSDALAAGASYPAITVAVSVAANAAASVTNQAAVSGGGESNTANDSASDLTTIDPVQTWPLTVTVSGSGSVGAGSGAISGCTASAGICSDFYNDGAVVTLTETPGAHYLFSGWGGACSGAATTCQVTMTQAQNVTAAFTVFQPDLRIAKSHSGNFTQGGTGSYTLAFTNIGVDPSYGAVSVADNPPAAETVTGLSGIGWSCDVPTATCTRSDALASGASYPAITVAVAIDGNAAASITNSATVSGGGDVNGANNSSSDPTTIVKQQFPLNATIAAGQGAVASDIGGISCNDAGGTCSASYDNGTLVTLTETPAAHFLFTGWGGACSGTATTCQVTLSQARNVNASFSLFQPDLTIVKSHSGNFTQGSTGSYTLLVSNLGADPSYGTVTVAENPPGAETVTGMSGSGWSCNVPTSTCTRSDALAAGASYPAITVAVAVDGNAPASATNNTTVSGGGDVNAANNSSSDSTTIAKQQFPLNVTVSGSGSVGADSGAVSGCTSSAGVCSGSYDNGTLVTLSETPAAHFNFTGWGGACSGTATTCQVAMSQARNVTATFTIFQPDLTIVKSHSGSFVQGGTGTYTLLVSNLGVDPTYAGVSVVDNAPAAETVTGVSGTGWACDVPTATCTRADALAAGASYPAITVTVAIGANAAASLTNAATVSGGGDVNGLNNSSSDPTTIAKQQFPLTAAIGAGQGTVTTDSGGVNCNDAGGTCSANFDNGTSVTLSAAGRNGQQFTGWSGDCSGSSPSCQVTMDQARNVTASFATPPASPDLVLVKSHSGNFTEGSTGSYTMTASNLGGTPTSGSVSVVDTAPAGLTITGLSGSGWSCDVPTATCTRSDALAAGASYPAITVAVSVAVNAAGSVTNDAAVSGGGESNTGNDSASDLTTIDPVPTWPLGVTVSGSGSVGADSGAVSGCTASGGTCNDSYADGAVVTLTATPGAHFNFAGWGGACSGTAATCQVTMSQARSVTAAFTVFQPDLTIAKSHSGTFTQGGTGSYTLAVSNLGVDPSYGTVTVSDATPAGLTVTGLSGTGWTCDVAGGFCTRSDALAGGAGYPTITVTVAIDGNAAASLTNTGTVSGGGDVNGANNSSSDPTTIAKQQFPLTVTVTGSGQVDASSGAVSACLSSGGVCTGGYDNGTLVTLTATPGAHFRFSGWGGACSGTSATCQVTMDHARNVSAIFTIFQPDLTIAKSHLGNFTQGGTGSYTLLVSNIGVDPSYGTVSVTDAPPVSLTITGLSGTGWSCDVPTVSCTRSDALAAGASYPAITATVAVDGNAPASATNSAAVSGGGDVNGANNSSSDPTTIAKQQFPLSVAVTGPGSVGADSGAVSGCTSSAGVCTDSYDNGTHVTLTETPDAQSAFSGWGGACSGSGTTCQVTMSQVRTVTATFVALQSDLTIAKSHVGNFTQSGTGSYTLVVSNVGAATTSGSVSVTDSPPSDLMVTALAGTGWSCDVPTATCTRSNGLAPGASYPAITVTVAVDGNAAASVTNSATVSGGGDPNGTNNSATDPTTVTPQQFPLNVTVSGSGSVGANTGAISGCTSSAGVCSDSYANGALVTLTATSGAHFHFGGWGGACSGTSATCQVTMDQARNVTAAFTVFQPDLTIVKSHIGSFVKGGTGSYTLLVSNLGSDPSYGTVTVTDATPAGLTVAGLSGTGWTCDVPTATCTRSDAVSGAGSSYPAIAVAVSVAANAAASLSNQAAVAGGGDINGANNSSLDPTTIAAQVFPLSVSIAAGDGTVTTDTGGIACTDAGGTCSVNYADGTLVTLTAAGRNGQQFTGWSDACSGNLTSCQVTMDQARHVSASFTAPPALPAPPAPRAPAAAPQPFPLHVTVSGSGMVNANLKLSGCTASSGVCSQDYDPGTLVTLKAVPGKGQRFVGWSGACSGSSPSCDVPMNQVQSVSARFASATMTLKVKVKGKGSAKRGGAYRFGARALVRAKAAPGWRFVRWSDDCSGRRTHCAVQMTKNRVVTAIFAPMAKITLAVPDRLVFHMPYDSAAITAHAELGGRPARGATVRVTFHCPGEPKSAHRAVTDAHGNIHFTEARWMVNQLRILKCTVAATTKISGQKARDTAAIHFIHPYWLRVASQATDGSDVVIAAYGRPGSIFDVHVNGQVVARATVGRTHWVQVHLQGAHPGDLVELAGVGNHHFSHEITVGMNPADEIVHGSAPVLP